MNSGFVGAGPRLNGCLTSPSLKRAKQASRINIIRYIHREQMVILDILSQFNSKSFTAYTYPVTPFYTLKHIHTPMIRSHLEFSLPLEDASLTMQTCKDCRLNPHTAHWNDPFTTQVRSHPFCFAFLTQQLYVP